jgi:HEAT repeat protein
MHTLQIQECLDVLNKKPVLFFNDKYIADKLNCLERLEKIGTPNTILHLIGFLKSTQKPLREAALNTILVLFSKVNMKGGYVDCFKYLSIEKSDLSYYQQKFNPEACLVLLAMASFNRDGYVRERAIKQLALTNHPQALTFILLRLGDWVEPVRKTAHNVIRKFLVPRYLNHILKQLFNVQALLNVRRTDLSAIYNEIVAFVCHQPFTVEFLAMVNKLDDKTRNVFYRIYLKDKQLSKELIQAVAKDKSFIVRSQIFRLLPFLEDSFQKQLIAALLRDKCSGIRVMALHACRKHAPVFEDSVMTMLSDEAADVRALCRYILKDAGLSFDEIYRGRVKQHFHLLGSLAGLAEVSTSGDIDLFEEHIKNQNSHAIISCLSGLNKFSSEKSKHYGLIFLAHSNVAVRNKAVEVLYKNVDREVLGVVRAMYPGAALACKKSILLLYSKIGGWVTIADIIMALTDEYNEVQNLAWQLLYQWKQRAVNLFTTPQKEDFARAKQMLDATDTTLIYDRALLLQQVKHFIK